MPSKVREPRQPSLEGLNDHITAAGPLQRDGPPDRCGWARENRADAQGSHTLPGRDRTEWAPCEATAQEEDPPWCPPRCPPRCGAPPSGDAGPAASLYLWKVLKPRPESSTWLRAIPEDHPGVSTESYAPSGWNQEHICWTQSWWKMPAREGG